MKLKRLFRSQPLVATFTFFVSVLLAMLSLAKPRPRLEEAPESDSPLHVAFVKRFAGPSRASLENRNMSPNTAAAAGSTCQNSVNPLSTDCETWLARYASKGSSDDRAAAMVVSADGQRIFITGQSGLLDTVTDFATAAYDAGSGQQIWATRYDGPGHGVDEARAISISPDGSRVYVTGRSAGVTVGNSGSTYQYATIAYESASGAELWTARFDGLIDNPGVPLPNETADPRALMVSPDGSRLFVTGQVAGALGPQYATVAYDTSTGNQLWRSYYTAALSTYNLARSLSVSPDGTRVYVTGTSAGATTKYDYATVAYDAVTGVQLWVSRYDGPSSGYDQATAVDASPDGTQIYVTGSSAGANGYPDYTTVAYGAVGGEQRWVTRYAGPGNAFNTPSKVRVSPDGSRVFVTGENVVFVDQQHSVSQYPTVAYDAASGVQEWVATVPGPNDDAYVAVSLIVSPDSQSVYVAQMGKEAAVATNGDYAAIRYDAATGAMLWEADYAGTGGQSDLPWAVAVSPDGAKVFVTGTSPGTNTHNDAATLAFDTQTGSRLWLQVYDGLGLSLDEAVAIAASPDSKTVYVAGWSQNGTPSGIDYATAAYDAATGVQKWFARYHRADNSQEIARGLAVSHDGQKVFVTGYTDAGYNGAPPAYTTVAYDAASGNQLWVDFFTASTDSDINSGTAQAITVSPDDARVYVTGNVAGSKGGLTSYNKFGTVAYDAQTGLRIWDVYYAGSGSGGSNIAWSIGVTPDGGRVVVAGQVINNLGSIDFGTVAYDAATGGQKWAASYNGPVNNFDSVRSLAMSPDGASVYVTGESYGSGNAYVYATLAYDIESGVRKWLATYAGPGRTGDLPESVAASPDGTRVYVTGLSGGTGTAADYGTVAYDSLNGAQIWVARYAQPGSDLGAAVTVSPDSSLVYVTGESAGAGTSGDYATIIYDAATGSEKLAARYDGPADGEDLGSVVAVSPDGWRFFVAGSSPGEGTGSDFATLAYDISVIGAVPSPTPEPVQVTTVVSRKVHGAAGPFDVVLPASKPHGIECRSGGAAGDFSMIFSFSSPLTNVASASVTSGTGQVSSSAVDSQDAHEYVVNLTGVTNAQEITVTLHDANDSAGHHSPVVSASMGLLLGDTTGDGSVNSADISQAKSQSGQGVTSSNFRTDVTVDGSLNSADISTVKAQSGTALAGPQAR